MEYVGEVLDYREFKKRTKKYDTDDKIHHYFMALNADQIIDATRKGSISRFINHSCDPNSETQKAGTFLQMCLSPPKMPVYKANVNNFFCLQEWNN